MYYAENVVRELKQAEEIAVFGAGIMALGVVSCLMEPPYGLQLRCCLVSDKKGNPDFVSGIPVFDFNEAEGKLGKDAFVVIAAVDKNLASMEKSLRDHGYHRLLPLTYEGDLWSLIRGNLYRERREMLGKPYLILEEELGEIWKNGWEEKEKAETGAGLEKEQEAVWKNGWEDRKKAEVKTGLGKELEERPEKKETSFSGKEEEKEAGKAKKNFQEKREKQEKSVKVYRACCHVDRKLTEDLSRYSWETPIQVGAALTGERICEICDNTGENISHKNEQYCELTALYWIWKNDDSDYVGLSHYRRHFEVKEEILKKLAVSKIDVALTIPIYDVPSVEEVYRRDHVGADWTVMMEGIAQHCPEYLEAAKELSRGNFYYAYNMFMMRREILEHYCEWLFPLLSYCEEHCGGRERDRYQGRYIGFLAEHLMSVYFLYHEKEYKIVHVRKHFVEW